MPRTAPDLTIPITQARTFWRARQGLAAPLGDTATAAVERTGWARTLGGVDVYLALRARHPSLTRAALEEAVSRGALRVVPAVRGCIYLAPARDVPVVLALAADLTRARSERDLDRAGLPRREVEALADAIDGVLKAGPKTTPAIRKALPDGAIRNLGEKGKKAGVSSPLPVALRELEFAGRIERIPVGARLDTEKYEWRRAKPAKRASAGRDFAERVQLVARRFFEWFGPATLKELTAWSGLTARDAKAAVAALPLVPVAIEGHADDAWALEADRDALVDASPTASFDFLAFEDNLLIIHGGPGAHADAAYHDRPLASWGMQKPTTLGAAKHIAWRTILFKGEIIGYWEYDLDKGELVHALFDGPPKGQKRALAQRSEELAAFLRDDLGHARSFSLDTDEAIRARVAGLRAML